MKITRDPRIEPVPIRPGLYSSQWMLLPGNVRARLAEVFELTKTGGSLVQDNRQLSDGYTDKDLEIVTITKMQEYLETENTDFLTLLTGLRSKIEQEIEEEKNKTTQEIEKTVAKRTYRTKRALQEAKEALELAEKTV